MHIGGGRMSWGYSNPQQKSGDIQALPTSFSSKDLFDSIFVPPTTGGPKRTPVVDRVLQSYKNLRNGANGDAARLSASDRQRLDDHMDRLAELQKRVGATVSCESVQPPGAVQTKNNSGVGFEDNTSQQAVENAKAFYSVFNDVIVAAFMCGSSRIATIHTVESWRAWAGSWHQEVAHQARGGGTAQAAITEGNRSLFEWVFLDLANKLNVEEANGTTYLDNTLMMWTHESGPSTHDPVSLPVVTAGSAAGFFKTGNYVDYSNAANSLNWPWQDLRPGILYNQWLATVLQSMGVPPSEFEAQGQHGYGVHYRESSYVGAANSTKAWPDRLQADASKIVPFLKK
jgi:hypothetical protein